MRSERGSAIAIVLLILGVVSLVGAGLLLQSSFDTKVTQAQKNYDRTFGLADSAASLAYPEILAKDTVAYKGVATTIWSQTIDVKPYIEGASTNDASFGRALAQAILEGYDTDPSQLHGWELGTGEGYHVQFWIALGTGSRKGSGERLPETSAYIAAKKFAKN